MSLGVARDLLISPYWGTDEPTIAFDRNSGDYWIVTSTARRMLEILLEIPAPAPFAAVAARMAAPGGDTKDLAALVAELAEQSIIRIDTPPGASGP